MALLVEKGTTQRRGVGFWVGTEYLQFKMMAALNQGSPAPGSWTGTGLWAAQQEACSGQTSKASSVLIAAPHCGIPAWALPPVRTGVALDFHRSRNPLWTAHYDELYNYFIIYHHAIIIKCTIKVTCLNHPETIPLPQSTENFSSMKQVRGA